MTTEKKTIRTVADLAALPDAELANCLIGLRLAIQAHKTRHAKALAGGALPAGAPLNFVEYVWSPGLEHELGRNDQFTRETPVGDLPLRHRARQQLLDLRALVLEDISTLSEADLLIMKDIGASTVARLREVLASVGLNFAASSDPETAEYQINRAILHLDPEELRAARQGLSDDGLITRLGLREATVKQARRAGWSTVGMLRGATLLELCITFGKMGVRDVLEALEQTGEGLRCQPSPIELWRANVLQVEDLVQPHADSTPIRDIEPWVGAMVDDLMADGIATLGQLRPLHRAGRLHEVRGVGKSGAQRLHDFLTGTKPGQPPSAKRAGGAPSVNSVFSLGGGLTAPPEPE